MKITQSLIEKFRLYLINEEKSAATVEKYIHDITAFSVWTNGKNIGKTDVISYKNELTGIYQPSSVNSILSSLNSFFAYKERNELKVKALKIQKQIFKHKEKELTKAEYELLLNAAKEKNERIYYIMQTICACGIRVSELKYITVEAVAAKTATIKCKGKMREVFLPKELCEVLTAYIKKQKIKEGSVFVTSKGKPIDRSNIWRDMKKLCEIAGVEKSKVFPHNLRSLFARVFYSVHKDIVRLADILGHSSVNTTRIYTMETGEIHRKQIQRLGLVKMLN